MRRPIEFGNLAVSKQYTRTEVAQDLTLILVAALRDLMRMERSVFPKFSVILVVGAQMPKWQVRTLIEMICDMDFKQVMLLLEPVAATYAMAAPAACVLDVGHT